MDTPNRWRPPDLASWRVFSVIVALLLGALALEGFPLNLLRRRRRGEC